MKKLIYLFVAVILVSGCASYWNSLPWSIDNNRKKLMELEIGMTKKEVINVMGDPYNREAYALPNGHTLEFLIYLTKYTDSGSIPDSDTTPICFEDGKVTGWGRNFYVERKQRYEIEIRNR
ncbi:MAG: DUF3192 domain-containing protein [Candidatus Omnitrophica bacterium]|nr:DUF3192 domain-containing protein [Candidatus Omnitrophota bacterium]MDD5351685.1 DUF3192 domain-containing protein [Candidatus Omnitrophota bacterium]MDD5550895.1 DUF3192 domain-containing protein [Candidatus Omnitrophota bacterium]